MSNLDQPFLRDQVFDMVEFGMRCRGESPSYFKLFTQLPGESLPKWYGELSNKLMLSNIHATFFLSSEQCNYLMRSE